MEIIRTTIPLDVAAAHLSAYLGASAAGEREVLLLLSGGAWFSVLDKVTGMSDLSPRVTIGVLDERFSEDPAVNNFAQMMETEFYARAKAAGALFIDSRVRPDETHAEYTRRFELALVDWHTKYPDGATLVTLGMGEDGHTAGIFPDSDAITSTQLVTADEVPTAVNQYPLRTTVTAHFLHTKVTAAIALVDRTNKCEMLEQICAAPAPITELPARVWHTMSALTVVTSCSMSI